MHHRLDVLRSAIAATSFVLIVVAGRTNASEIEIPSAAALIAGYDANEADHHEPDRQAAFWGANRPRPLAGKRR